MAVPPRIYPIDDVRAFVRWRERLLIDAEDTMFRACRDRATTDEERAFWNRILAARAQNQLARLPGWGGEPDEPRGDSNV